MGTRTRAAVCLVAAGIGVLGGLLLAVLAAGTATGLPFDLPLMGSALFGNPQLDLWFLARSSSSGAFITIGLAAAALGVHLLRLGLQHRPQAVEVLPHPAQWRPRGRIGLAVFAAAIAAFLLAGGIAAGVKWAPGGLLTGMGLMLGAASWSLPYLASLRRGRLPVVRCEPVAGETDGETGLVVARSPRTYAVLGLLAVALALPGAIGLFEGLHEVRGRGLLGSQQTLMSLVFGAVFLVLAVVLAGGVLYRVAHRDRLVLTPTRLIHRTRRSSFAVEWNEIQVPFAVDLQGNPQLRVAVSPECPVSGVANKRINRQLADGQPRSAELEFGLFAIDPVTLYHALIWYGFYPETRSELATQEAVERVRDADLLSTLSSELDRSDEELLEELEREERANQRDERAEPEGEADEFDEQAGDPEEQVSEQGDAAEREDRAGGDHRAGGEEHAGDDDRAGGGEEAGKREEGVKADPSQ